MIGKKQSILFFGTLVFGALAQAQTSLVTLENVETLGKGCPSVDDINIAIVENDNQNALEVQLSNMDVSAGARRVDNKTCVITFDLVPEPGQQVLADQAIFNIAFDVDNDNRGLAVVSLKPLGDFRESTIAKLAGSGVQQLVSSGENTPETSECGERLSLILRSNLTVTAIDSGNARLSMNAQDLEGGVSISLPVETAPCS